MSTPAADVLGAIIAGGVSSRFGSPKALARVRGERVVDRVHRALGAALGGGDIIAIVNDAVLAAAIGLPQRRDVIGGAGALAGVHAALLWASERGQRGVLAVGCDMPFLSPALMGALLAGRDGHDVVIPESEGRRGVEPLCAFYGISCIAPVERAIARGDARMIGFHADVVVQRIPLDAVRAFGDPTILFMNLNTEADRIAAEQRAAALP
jgi:molybdopterin-guanine dinucleotide biosynthesis protein A